MPYELTMFLLCVLFMLALQSFAADGFVPLPGGTWEVPDGVIVESQDTSEKRTWVVQPKPESIKNFQIHSRSFSRLSSRTT